MAPSRSVDRVPEGTEYVHVADDSHDLAGVWPNDWDRADLGLEEEVDHVGRFGLGLDVDHVRAHPVADRARELGPCCGGALDRKDAAGVEVTAITIAHHA